MTTNLRLIKMRILFLLYWDLQVNYRYELFTFVTDLHCIPIQMGVCDKLKHL